MDPLKNLAAPTPAKKAFSFFDEFKKFAFKGNVIDLAVGVVIGTAFGKIIESLVKNVIMPFVGLILPGEQGYQGWKVAVGSAEVPYGLFLGELVNFLIITFVLFLFISKFLGWMMRSREQEAKGPPPLTKEQELLVEIRDLLKAAKQPAAAATEAPAVLPP